MAEIKLFRIAGAEVVEVLGTAIALEKSLQIQQHLESTWPARSGRPEWGTRP